MAARAGEKMGKSEEEEEEGEGETEGDEEDRNVVCLLAEVLRERRLCGRENLGGGKPLMKSFSFSSFDITTRHNQSRCI
jgi:hypothetical protein